MADISVLARLIQGTTRNVDIASNTLVTTSIKVGGGVSNTELTKAILDRLVSLQNGSDVDSSYHTHDGRYFTETELGSTGGTSGADRIGVNNTPVNYSAASQVVQDHLEGIDAALAAAGGTSFDDSIFELYDNLDNSKLLKFQLANISAATTRTITMADANVDLADVNNSILRDGSRSFTANQPMGGFKLTGLAAGSSSGDSVRYEQAILISGVNAFAADQSMGGFKLTNLADPVAAQDAVSLSYLQARLNGLTPKAPARAATTANIALSGAQTIDGVSIIAGDRVLVKNQSAPEENGIYVAAAGAWSRATDMDSLSPIDEVNGAWVAIREGSQAGQVFVQYGVVSAIGTDPINFSYFNPIAGLIGGDMITFAGSTFSVDLATVSGLESTNPGNVAGQLRIKLEASNPSLRFTGSNELAIKFDPAGALLAGAAGTAVQVDNSTIEISSNALRIKDLGVTLAKLAANSVDENKIVSTSFSSTGAITGGGGSKIQVEVDDSSIERNSNALRIKSGAYDQLTITGGSGSAAAVQHAPSIRKVMVAGESFAADTTFAVRMARTGETAGRVYKADYDASSVNNFYVIGLVQPTGAVSAGQNITVIMMGEISLLANDTAFAAGEVGEPVHLVASGAWDAVSQVSYPDLSNRASVRIGMVQETGKIMVQAMQLNGIA
ncbi:MAG TPA: hypothetical protein DDY18_11020 [Flavobacterium sp.]|jgi:hypothetical protein|nr:hypothetical protein [Flavobacterium sp.]